jgi:hypothetical protein
VQIEFLNESRQAKSFHDAFGKPICGHQSGVIFGGDAFNPRLRLQLKIFVVFGVAHFWLLKLRAQLLI